MFKEIYENRNISLTNEQTLHRLVEEIAETVKPVCVFNLEGIEWALPDIIAWICAFANKCHIDLREIMCKYVENPPGKLNLTTRIKPVDIIGTENPETFEDWQLYLGFIYRDENANIAPATMMLKIIEDVGMTSRRLRTRSDTAEVKKHLAGVLAWTIALANKFQIKIDDIIYKKYPNHCHRCRSKPCECFQLSTVFISYTLDTTEEMQSVKDLVTQLALKAETFKRLGPKFYPMRMFEPFNVINRSDGAIVLLKDQWSENVWAELVEIFKTLDEKNVWIFAKESKKIKDKKLESMLEGIKHYHKIQYYSSKRQLLQSLKKGLQKRIKMLKELEARIPAKTQTRQ